MRIPISCRALLCLFALTRLPLLSQDATDRVVEVAGDFQYINYLPNKEVRYATENSFELAATPGRFKIRLLWSTEILETGALIVSDFKDIYNARKLRQLNIPGEQPGPMKDTYATFSKGVLPGGHIDGFPAQSLALAYLLCAPGKENMINGTELKKEYHPEVMSNRVRRIGGGYLKTEIQRGADGAITGVRFWTFKPGTTQTKLERTEDCFLVGELTVKSAASHMPGEITSILYAMPQGVPLGTPLLEVRFKGAVRTHGDTTVMDQVAYDSAVDVKVTDERFPEVKGLSYLLKNGTPLPFMASTSQRKNVAELAYEETLAKRKSKGTRRTVVLWMAGATCIIAAGFVFWKAASKRSVNAQAAKQQTV